MDRRELNLALLLWGLLLAACQATTKPPPQEPAVEAFLREFEDGELTEAEAWRMLGNPTMRYDDGNTLGYLIDFEIHEGETVRVPRTWDAVQRGETGVYSLVLVFDPRTRKLTRHSLVSLVERGPR